MAYAMHLERTLRIFLVVLSVFLAVSAVPGGLALLAGFYSPPVEELQGSVFSSFTVPGLALVLLVGGSAALAAVLLLQRNRHALVSAIASGLVVMSFEFVEVLSIGSPHGPPRIMQILYFCVGSALVVVSLALLSLQVARPRTSVEEK